MVETSGSEWARARIEKFNGDLDANLVRLEKDYWPKEDDER